MWKRFWVYSETEDCQIKVSGAVYPFRGLASGRLSGNARLALAHIRSLCHERESRLSVIFGHTFISLARLTDSSCEVVGLGSCNALKALKVIQFTPLRHAHLVLQESTIERQLFVKLLAPSRWRSLTPLSYHLCEKLLNRKLLESFLTLDRADEAFLVCVNYLCRLPELVVKVRCLNELQLAAME